MSITRAHGCRVRGLKAWMWALGRDLAYHSHDKGPHTIDPAIEQSLGEEHERLGLLLGRLFDAERGLDGS